MFCPVCKAEYRTGFTHCSECDAELVERLEDAPPPDGEQNDPATPYLLWEGSDIDAHGALCCALDSAKIAYHDRERNVGLIPGLSTPVYMILVHGRDRDAARALLDDLRLRPDLGEPTATEDEANELPEEIPEPGQEGDDLGPAQDDIAEDFRPEEATAEVWAGDDAEMAETVRFCLRENGIGCVVDEPGGKKCVRVIPASEERAREIVREVVEGTPLA